MSDERTSWTTGSFTAHPGAQSLADAVPGLVLVYSRVHESIPSVLPFDGRVLTLGREADNTLVLREAAVSRYHARIELEPEGFVIRDVGSTNGTLVNGKKVMRHRLVEQDVVRVGDSVFRFAANEAIRYSAYRITGEKDERRCPPHGILDPLLVGGMQIDRVLDHIAKLARTGLSVVVHGESGTGKELVARELHRWSGRRGPFQAINCAAIPPNLLESELFGHRRGAFTGAAQDKLGLVQAASGGTVFLDEIGDLPLEAQAKLLRVLQEREVTPVGGTHPVKVDVRFVSATHRHLESLVAEGRFRGDLFARICEASVTLPPLRARREDLFRLVRHFLHKSGAAETALDVGTMLALAHYDFPYNVRELESAIRLSLAMAQGQPIEVRHLPTIIQRALEAQTVDPAQGMPPRAAPAMSPMAYAATYRMPAAAPAGPHAVASGGDEEREPTAEFDAAARGPAPSEDELRALLARYQGNVAAVGREYGKERMQVHRWMKRYGIDPDAYRR